ncbi:DUF6716 putative glycosyltransferase [Lysinimonas soli]|uniref:DUF6716 putative glycosyltransferase n=1 Tax=Lysinimonas soli TaxID=1074233 RepID=A0ABW0NP99_9MICO
MRIIAIADSDSYLKWAAATLGALPTAADRELLLVETPVLPSETQRRAALAVGGMDPSRLVCLPLTGVVERIRRERPDAVLVAVRGPVAAVLIRLIAELPDRPVIVTGLPGISIPATRKALAFRRQADLFLLHSRREIRDFTRLSRVHGWTHRFALASLPFLERRSGEPGDALVFAAQAIVPREREDRLEVLRMLLAAARADPARPVVIKIRARVGEQQTHAERDSYPELLDELAEQGVEIPANLRVSSEPMSSALDRAQGLLTVSSTAVIEAIARGIPVIVLDTFGVSDALINPVFEHSGLFGGEDDVIARRFRTPHPGWLDDNYSHAPEADDWTRQLDALVAARAQGVLPAREPVRASGGVLRRAWERKRAFGDSDRSVSGAVALAVGTPARATMVMARRLARRYEG